jgi:hypothetical protein
MVKQRWQLYVPMHELAFLMEVALLSTTSMASSSCSFVQLLLECAINDPFVLFLFLVLLLVQGEGEHFFCQCLFGPCTTPLMRHIEHHVAPTPLNLVFKRWSPHIWGPQKVSFCPSQNHTKNTQSLARLGNVWITCSFVTHVVSIKWKNLQSPPIQILVYCCCVGNGCESQATRGWSTMKSMITN